MEPYTAVSQGWTYTNLSLLPAVFAVIPVQNTQSLRAGMKAHWHLNACPRGWLKAYLIPWLIACLREPRFREPCFGRSGVFYRKLLADGKL